MNGTKTSTFVLAALLCAPVFAGDLTFTGGWVRESIPGQSNSVAYLEVANGGKYTCELQSVASVVAERVEIHEHRHHEGKMQMRKVETLPIPAGSAVAFAPGGLHLMLMDLTQPLKAGDTVAFSFSAGKCGDTEAVFPVKAIQ